MNTDGTARVCVIPLRVWELDEPAPREWIVPGLVPTETITILYGDGGTLKSYLALCLAIAALVGGEFFGLRVKEQSAVLYVDAELDDQEFLRRAFWVARGMGLDGPPKGLFYVRLPGSLRDPGTLSLLREAIRSIAAGFVVVDSLTVGTPGSDVKEVDVVTELMSGLESLGTTVVAIDHVPKPTPDSQPSHARPFGSAFKFNLARSVLHLYATGDGALLLQQTKSNFGRIAKTVGVESQFDEDERLVTFAAIAQGDQRLKAASGRERARNRVAEALAQHGPAKPTTLAFALGMNLKTVQNHLTQLRCERRAEPAGDGTWHVPKPLAHSGAEAAGGPEALPVARLAAAGSTASTVRKSIVVHYPRWIVEGVYLRSKGDDGGGCA